MEEGGREEGVDRREVWGIDAILPVLSSIVILFGLTMLTLCTQVCVCYSASISIAQDGMNATLRCPGEECGGTYVTRICQGTPVYDSGKFHNHCMECPDLGECHGKLD